LGEPLIVELVGLPGAGKSAIAAQALGELRRRGHTVRGRDELGSGSSRGTRAGRIAWSWFRRPTLLAGTLAIGVGGGRPGLPGLQHALKLAAWAPRLAALHSGERLLLDQGVVQQAWSALLRAPSRDAQISALLTSVIRSSPVRFAFVYCEVTPELALSRIAGRETGRSSFDKMAAGEARRLLVAESQSLRGLFERAAEVARARRLVLDAAGPLSESSAAVAALVEAG
jgi:hypothetical protein